MKTNSRINCTSNSRICREQTNERETPGELAELKRLSIPGCYSGDKAFPRGSRRNARKFRFIWLMHLARCLRAHELRNGGAIAVHSAAANALGYMYMYSVAGINTGERNSQSLSILRFYVSAVSAKNQSISSRRRDRRAASSLLMSIRSLGAAVFQRRKHPTLYSDNEISRKHEGRIVPRYSTSGWKLRARDTRRVFTPVLVFHANFYARRSAPIKWDFRYCDLLKRAVTECSSLVNGERLRFVLLSERLLFGTVWGNGSLIFLFFFWVWNNFLVIDTRWYLVSVSWVVRKYIFGFFFTRRVVQVKICIIMR